jgi:hypothetical protein
LFLEILLHKGLVLPQALPQVKYIGQTKRKPFQTAKMVGGQCPLASREQTYVISYGVESSEPGDEMPCAASTSSPANATTPWLPSREVCRCEFRSQGARLSGSKGIPCLMLLVIEVNCARARIGRFRSSLAYDHVFYNRVFICFLFLHNFIRNLNPQILCSSD